MQASIRAFVGVNGAGKTLAMVEALAIPAWKRGEPVVANLQLYPEALGLPEHLYVRLESFRQLPELHDCTLLLDEINGTFPSRESSKMPPELGRILNQLRKPRVPCGWTGPAWGRADKILREVTQLVTVCRGFLPDQWERQPKKAYFPPKAVDENGRPKRLRSLWMPNRLFSFVAYDARDFEEFTQAQATKLRPKSRAWYWRQNHLAHLAYTTGEQVALLDHLDEFGTCFHCGGHRRRPPCSCLEQERGEAGSRVSGEGRPALSVNA